MSEGDQIKETRIRSKKQNVFPEETKVLKEIQLLLEDEVSDAIEYKKRLTFFTEKYEELLDQTKLITKVSDRQQKKINKINDTLSEINVEMERKNVELQDTLDDLSRAKVGRKATTITGVVFVGLFLLTEAFIEPYIENYLHTSKGILHDHEFAVGLSLKGVLALMLRPIERVVEKLLLKQEKEKKEKALALQRANAAD